MELNERVVAMERGDLVASLQKHAHNYRCGMYMSYLTTIEQTQLYQDLQTERVERKYHDLKSQYEHVGKDWNQTMFVMIMRYMSDKFNKENYTQIAYRIGYATLIHERGNIRDVEALLIATSGLMGLLPIDEFTSSIRKRGEHLMRKYEITPLSIAQWSSKDKIVTRAPIVRLVQMAQLISKYDMLFNEVIGCKTRRDILSLFDLSIPKEWLPYVQQRREPISKLSLQADKIDLFGINVIIPILYTFGHLTSNDEFIDTASNLSETIPAESNFYITGWRGSGLHPVVAYESQALIQLGSVYCRQSEEDKRLRKRGKEVLSRCEECPVFKHLCSRVSAIERVPAFLEF